MNSIQFFFALCALAGARRAADLAIGYSLGRDVPGPMHDEARSEENRLYGALQQHADRCSAVKFYRDLGCSAEDAEMLANSELS
jgi:hypothetical protein